MAPSDDVRALQDSEAVTAYSYLVWSYKQGEMVSLLIHLGDRVGLFRALAGAGPLTVAELAARAGLHERWVREWAEGMAAAKLVELHPEAAGTGEADRFELSEAGAAVLADEEGSLVYAAGAFFGGLDPSVLAGLEEAFRTGVGLSYDQQGPTGAHRTERMLGPWARLAFVPVIIPALDGVQAKLEAGALVADVGCGAGVALRALARAFPRSTFHGYDPSTHAMERAEAKVAEEGLTNVELFRSRGEDLPADGRYDFLYTFDCLHDMTQPGATIAAIARALKPDGTWLIKDIRSTGELRRNLKNPLLAMFYGFSVTSCMSSALSEPGGMGLGTLGFHPRRAEEMVRAAGFTSFTRHDFQDKSNLYYEVRFSPSSVSPR
jgi:2-polyprenyl-3-methyl-5-hydroxy-6-metoxy-1,4-benzoquinol methylase